MSGEYYKIKDSCREGLNPYLKNAVSQIPSIKNVQILDAGCGTGVPTLMLAKKYSSGFITAVDLDAMALSCLSGKVTQLKLSDRFRLLGGSVLNINFKHTLFDIILAEGFFNTVGFEKGFEKLDELLKTRGFLIIHDTFKNTVLKKSFFKSRGYEIIHSALLNEKDWWHNYYKPLEKKITHCKDPESRGLFKTDLLEIKQYRTNPFQFKSFYFVAKKTLKTVYD